MNPIEIDLNAQGTACSFGHSGTFTASEVGYSGNFNAVSNNTAIATVTPAQSTGTFTVTATSTTNGGPGTTITVTDTLGHSASEIVRITICLP